MSRDGNIWECFPVRTTADTYCSRLQTDTLFFPFLLALNTCFSKNWVDAPQTCLMKESEAPVICVMLLEGAGQI